MTSASPKSTSLQPLPSDILTPRETCYIPLEFCATAACVIGIELTGGGSEQKAHWGVVPEGRAISPVETWTLPKDRHVGAREQRSHSLVPPHFGRDRLGFFFF